MSQKKPENNKTILIIGISSFVGSNLAEYFNKDYKVIGTYFENPVEIKGVLTLKCNVLDREQIQSILYSLRPDIVIYCSGLHSVSLCASEVEKAEAINTRGFLNISEYSERVKAQVCYVSSQYVFGGDKENYIEMDVPDANTIYGKNQVASEFFIQKNSLNYLVFRCCSLYGRGINPFKENYFEYLEKRLTDNKEVRSDNLVKMGFLDVYYLAAIMHICFKKEITNRLIQVSSKDLMTHYEFANSYNKKFHRSSGNVEQGTWSFPKLLSGENETAVASSYNLETGNAEVFLSISMPTIEESLDFTYDRLSGKTMGTI